VRGGHVRDGRRRRRCGGGSWLAAAAPYVEYRRTAASLRIRIGALRRVDEV
jgi:hypothetical protein